MHIYAKDLLLYLKKKGNSIIEDIIINFYNDIYKWIK